MEIQHDEPKVPLTEEEQLQLQQLEAEKVRLLAEKAQLENEHNYTKLVIGALVLFGFIITCIILFPSEEAQKNAQVATDFILVGLLFLMGLIGMGFIYVLKAIGK